MVPTLRTNAYAAAKQRLRGLVIHLIAVCLMGGAALAEEAGRGATQITANYGVYWAGLHFGDVRLSITLGNSSYQMKGDGQFSVLGGLLYEWSGGATSAGKLGTSGPRPSLYTLSYSGATSTVMFVSRSLMALFRMSPRHQRNDPIRRIFPSPRNSFGACSIR